MMKSTLSLLLIVFISTFTWTTNAGVVLKMEMESESTCNLQFHPCTDVKDPIGKLDKAKFNGTCSGPVAILQKGTHVVIEFTFESGLEETALTSHVCGSIRYLPKCINFPLDQPDACKDSGLTCPVKAHKVVKFHSVLDVKSIYPSIGVYVRWELKDQKDRTVFCGIVPAKIS